MEDAVAGLEFRGGPGGPTLAGVTHPVSGSRLQIEDAGFFLVLDGRLWRQGDLRPLGGDDPREACCGGAGVEAVLRWRAQATGAQAQLTVTALQDGVRLEQAGLWNARVAAPTRLGRGDRVPPADLLAPVPGVLEAEPIWIGEEWFAGLDWPAAENACADGQVLCREFPGISLGRGESWTSHTLTLGAAPAGGQAEAFLAHLARLRGRPTRRAAFYFDWLTHASEGPTETELQAMVALLERLRERDGVAFDIYALDDGAVETRWSLYWDRHRLQHRRRFPHGLQPHARRLAAMGTDLGIWIGPDGFGPDGRYPRADDLVRMIRDWNVSLLKIDTCVSWPWRQGDAAANDAHLRRFEAMLAACRAARPDLVAINHRVTSSPYVLTMLDSTLWEGAESYPDVFLNNTDRPRLHTRHAAFGRGLPSYYGGPSDLLEDHGVCFNGDPAGWRDEVCVGAFGRGLALSPEIYGTLFLLPDGDYRDLGRAIALSRAWGDILSRPGRRTAAGDFVHTDGRRAVLCLLNDAWRPAVRRVRIGAELGLEGGGPFSLIARFPEERVVAVALACGEAAEVELAPFQALALEVVPGAPATPWADVGWRREGEDLVLVGPPGLEREVWVSGERRRVCFPGRARRDPAWVELGELAAGPPDAAAARAAEACRFALANDPAEWQVLASAAASAIPEVEACRAFFRQKLRREGTGVAANAWDGDPTTAWSDASHWRRLDNLWRLDLGAVEPLGTLEMELADFGGGPVFRDGERHGLLEPLWVEASADLRDWVRVPGHVFYTRNPYRTWPSAVIAEFPAGTVGRYLRVRAQGFAASDIRVLAALPGGGLEPVCRQNWHGTNLFGDRTPEAVYRAVVRVKDTWPGRSLALVVELATPTLLQQEVCLAWAEVGGALEPATHGSPRPLFHSYECDAGGRGPGFVWRLPVTEAWVGREVGVSLAWLGARDRGGQALAAPVVRGYLLSDGSPLAEVRLPGAGAPA